MSELNPYAAPKADESPMVPAEQLELNVATMGTRFLNLLIDQVVRLILSQVLAFAMLAAGMDDAILRFLLGLLLMVAYYVFMEGLFGVTIGKLITGTRVVDEEGNRPTFGQILGRSFSRLVPFEAFSFFNTPSVGWHDSWSGTRVIKVRR